MKGNKKRGFDVGVRTGGGILLDIEGHFQGKKKTGGANTS